MQLVQTDAAGKPGTAWFRDELPVEQWAELERQRLLYERPNTAFSFILEEHLLLRDLGGEDVTRELLDHILDLSELRNVEIQIMPLVRHHQHAAIDGPMQLIETPDHR